MFPCRAGQLSDGYVAATSLAKACCTVPATGSVCTNIAAAPAPRALMPGLARVTGPFSSVVLDMDPAPEALIGSASSSQRV